jgi:hypothetical protein
MEQLFMSGVSLVLIQIQLNIVLVILLLRLLVAPVVPVAWAVRAAPVPRPVSPEVALATAAPAAWEVTAVPPQRAPTVSGVLVVLRAVVAVVAMVVMAMRTAAVCSSMAALVVPGVLPVVRVPVVRVSLRVWSGLPVMVAPVVPVQPQLLSVV